MSQNGDLVSVPFDYFSRLLDDVDSDFVSALSVTTHQASVARKATNSRRAQTGGSNSGAVNSRQAQTGGSNSGAVNSRRAQTGGGDSLETFYFDSSYYHQRLPEFLQQLNRYFAGVLWQPAFEQLIAEFYRRNGVLLSDLAGHQPYIEAGYSKFNYSTTFNFNADGTFKHVSSTISYKVKSLTPKAKESDTDELEIDFDNFGNVTTVDNFGTNVGNYQFIIGNDLIITIHDLERDISYLYNYSYQSYLDPQLSDVVVAAAAAVSSSNNNNHAEQLINHDDLVALIVTRGFKFVVHYMFMLHPEVSG